MNDIEKQWCSAKLEVRGNRFKELYCDFGFGCVLIEQKERFTSILPSVNTEPLLATVNRSIGNGYERGIVMPRADEDRSYDPILPLTGDYHFIDGVDGGLVRVNKIKDGVKNWGLLALIGVDNEFEFMGVVIDSKGKISFSKNQDDFLVYDNLWNFYDKNRHHIPAERDNEIIDISLDEIRKRMNTSLVHGDNDSKENPNQKQNENEKVSYLEEVTVQNFKRFAERTSLDLSANITFIVGKNNAGKSTLLNAIDICCQYNLKRLNFDKDGNFYFAFSSKDDRYEDFVNRSSMDQKLMLSITSGGWCFEFKMKGSDGKAIVHEFSVSNNHGLEKLVFNPQEVNIVFGDGSEKNFNCTKPWIIDSDRSQENSYRNSIVHPEDYLKSLSGIDMLLNPLRGETEIAERVSKISMSIENSLDPCRGTRMIQVFAPIVPQGIDEKGQDFVSSAISEYAQIDNKDYHVFVRTWLTRMEMGDDFDVKKNKKGYTITITQQDGRSCNLSEMGTGTIHFVILCFKILSFVDKYKNNRFAPTLLIMEPEQNLHPMLQSHMVNFLMDISDLYSDSFQDSKERRHLKIIVETHSEYMIRRSQVIAKRFADRGKEIPFRTYYFPSEGKPYDMVYRKDGRFENKFGAGFTDESTMLSYQLI